MVCILPSSPIPQFPVGQMLYHCNGNAHFLWSPDTDCRDLHPYEAPGLLPQGAFCRHLPENTQAEPTQTEIPKILKTIFSL